jgi:hypothetical protein
MKRPVYLPVPSMLLIKKYVQYSPYMCVCVCVCVCVCLCKKNNATINNGVVPFVISDLHSNLILNFRPVLNFLCFLLGYSPASVG